MESDGRTGRAEGDLAGVSDALRELGADARDAVTHLAEALELERRVRERPLAALGVAAAAGFVLGGGLWPVLRPFARAAARSALSPGNLIALAAAVGAARAAGVGEETPRTEGAGSTTH